MLSFLRKIAKMEALSHAYDVIGIEDVNDTAKDSNNLTAKKLQFRGNFLLKIHDNGKYTITPLK